MSMELLKRYRTHVVVSMIEGTLVWVPTRGGAV